MSLRCRNPNELAFSGQDDCSLALATRQQRRRWRLAFEAICFTRALVSFSKIAQDKKQKILHSLSYAAIDIDDEIPKADHSVPFLNINQKKLTGMVKEKSFETLTNLGGVKGVVAILETDEKIGIQGKEAKLLHRINVFGANNYKKPPTKNMFSFVYEASKDTTIIILLICAILALGFGIKQTGWKEGWYDGGSIIFAVFLVVFVTAVSNFKKNRQFEKLSNESGDIKVEVVRDGKRQSVSIFEVVVGDVVCLKIGDQIPADGLFLKGPSLKVDESSMTGESDHIEINDSKNPFLLSGTKVTYGYGFMLITSVGMNTALGEMMSSISRDLDEQTPLQVRFNKLASYIGKIGLAVNITVLPVLLTRYFTGKTTDESGKLEFVLGATTIDGIMNSIIRIIAAADPEGLPLAATLTLDYSMKRMMADNALVRKLSACETMGSATTICTDKTGTLTLNEMKVTEFWVGKEAVKDLDIAADVYELLRQGAGLNTIGTVYKSNSASPFEISGSPTEKAILSWAVLDLRMNLDESKQNCQIIRVEAFNSEKKRSGVLMRRIHENVVHTHWKGAAEMILAMCSHYYDRSGKMKVIDGEERMRIGTVIKRMAAKSLRCIAFAHTKVVEEKGKIHERLEETGLTLLGLVGLKDPCRPGVRTAVESCKKAGVNVKMITGDNIDTARAIAIECGIFSPNEDLNNEAVVEGVQFRNYSPEERMAKIDNISVMARSSLFDKLLMVQCLKQKGHVVAVTGDGTNDAPALKEADIGLSMGIHGTEVAKESSDIIILDDNFSSVVTVLRWGRCVYNNVQKFVQFQLTVNVAALVISFIAAVSSGDVPLTAVQLLWVNLIINTLGALGLARERPTNQLMAKSPVGRSEPLITNIMWRNLVAQALYQVTVLLVLQFKGSSIFSVDKKVNNTLIFNTFVLCQIFNVFNARNLEQKNIFKGLHNKKLFMGIVGTTIILQVIMVQFLNRFANTKRLKWGQWTASVVIGAMSWLVGWLVKWIPVSGNSFSCFSIKEHLYDEQFKV